MSNSLSLSNSTKLVFLTYFHRKLFVLIKKNITPYILNQAICQILRCLIYKKLAELIMYPNHTNLKNSKYDSWNSNGINSFDLFSSIADAEQLTPSSEDTTIPTELDFLDFWYNNYLNYYGKRVNNTPDNSNDTQKPRDPNSNELQEILNHVPVLPSQSPLGLRENRVNFIMIATSLDQGNILKQLDDTLERETFRAIPLLFEKNNQEGQVDSEPIDPVTVLDKELVYHKNEIQRLECNERRPAHTLKRKQPQDIAKGYKEKRPRNKRSVEKPRGAGSRMTWFNTRTKDLESADTELEQRLKMFQAKDLLSA